MAAERVAAIVQARMGSTRFPGKTLASFGESTVLQHILRRLGRVTAAIEVWVATSELPQDDAIVEVCASEGVPVFRGEVDDVLRRFTACLGAMSSRPELVLRVCADRPLMCPVLADELLAAYEELGRPDYLANNLSPSYPDGLDLELVRADALETADRESCDEYEREHVTPFVYRRPERFRVAGLTCPFGNFSHVDVALDTPDDYDRLKRLHERLPDDYDYRDVLNAAELGV